MCRVAPKMRRQQVQAIPVLAHLLIACLLLWAFSPRSPTVQARAVESGKSLRLAFASLLFHATLREMLLILFVLHQTFGEGKCSLIELCIVVIFLWKWYWRDPHHIMPTVHPKARPSSVETAHLYPGNMGPTLVSAWTSFETSLAHSWRTQTVFAASGASILLCVSFLTPNKQGKERKIRKTPSGPNPTGNHRPPTKHWSYWCTCAAHEDPNYSRDLIWIE